MCHIGWSHSLEEVVRSGAAVVEELLLLLLVDM
jgi:hypothetical protein